MVMQITLAGKQARIINDPPYSPPARVVVVSFVADDVDAVVHNYHRLAARQTGLVHERASLAFFSPSKQTKHSGGVGRRVKIKAKS